VLGASVPGVLHVEHGRGCDDAHAWAAGDAVTVLAVADGAGSRAASAIGAHAAVARVLERVERDPAEPLPELFRHARAAVAEAGDELGMAAGDLATTLCVAVLTPEEVRIGQIGDGVAVIETGDGSVEAVAVADRFEYANQVVFLTSDDAFAHLKTFATADPVRGVALSTDGLRYKILDDPATGRPFAPFFTGAWEYARRKAATTEAIGSFLADVDDQTGDDKTLVLAVRGFAGARGAPRGLSAAPPRPARDEAPAG
jgi:Protein phosphatase 2C